MPCLEGKKIVPAHSLVVIHGRLCPGGGQLINVQRKPRSLLKNLRPQTGKVGLRDPYARPAARETSQGGPCGNYCSCPTGMRSRSSHDCNALVPTSPPRTPYVRRELNGQPQQLLTRVRRRQCLPRAVVRESYKRKGRRARGQMRKMANALLRRFLSRFFVTGRHGEVSDRALATSSANIISTHGSSIR